MIGFRDAPIRRKLTALMLVATVSGLLLAAPALIADTWRNTHAAAVRDLGTLTRAIADNSTAALTFDDARAGREILSALRAKPEVEYACLYQRLADGRATPFAAYPAEVTDKCPAQPEASEIVEAVDALTVVMPVKLAREQIGWLRVTQNLREQRSTLASQVVITLIILGASAGLSFAISWSMQGTITDPVRQLAETARRVSSTRDYSLRAPAASGDELGQLARDFNEMLAQIARSDAEIQHARDALTQEVQEKTQANAELEQALERLRQTQAQLVQSEKMASLGGLVAGIAHEINTPVGVGVTAASTLQAKAAEIRKQYSEQALKRSDLERFLNVAEDSSQIILKNLQRAADLITSFKRVAVDQSSDERRSFNLRHYIDEVLLSLAPKLKNSGHQVVVDCPGDLVLDSYPGALAQVLTNFVSNSLMHAFDGKPGGIMSIRVQKQGDHVVLRYGDNGVGIPPEFVPRVFDPFFTTKRGAGGSGLGMHIVYNLVTQILGGTVDIANRPGEGVEFTVRFPRSAGRMGS